MALTCRGGGRLVAGDGYLPAEAWEHDTTPGCFDVGCNHLACEACGQGVRAVGPWRLERGDVDWAAAHADATWPAGTDGVVRRDAAVRLYLCACQALVVDRTRAPALALDWDSFLGEEAPPWRCAGHPAVTLPWVVDGVEWSTADAAAAATRAALAGAIDGVPSFLKVEPAAWLVRCERLLQHTSLAAVIRGACAAALRDPEASVRTRAADFLRFRFDTAEAAEAARVLVEATALWNGAGDAFAPTRSRSERLQETIARRVQDGLATATEIEDVRAAIDAWLVPNGMLARALAVRDTGWFAPRMAVVFQRQPTRDQAFALIAAASKREDAALDAAVVALAPMAGREVVAEAVRGLMRGARRERLLVAIGG